VMHGVLVAEKGGLNIPADVRQRGLDWLTVYEQKQIALLDEGVARSKIKDPDELEKRKALYRLMADESDALVRSVLAEAGVYQRNMTAYLYRDRVGLSVYGKVLLALSLHASGEAPAELKMVEENIKQFWHTDAENQTGWLRLPAETRWWYWYGNEVEANAVYLKYLAQTAPKSPDAAALVKYLLNNRRNGTYWNSTRDTALCIEGFSAYLAASGELEPQMTIDLLLDDQVVKTFEIDRGNLFTFDNRFSLAGADVKSGPHKLEIRRRGAGPVYWNAYLTNFTLEDPIRATGLELKLSRKHFLLEKIDKQQTGVDKLGRPVDQQTEGYRRIAIDGETKLESGDLVEVQLMIESKNDYEYLIFEDFKAAGFEVMDQRSGYTGNELGAFVEFRDDRVAFLTRGIKRGQSQVTYRLRAEIPGLYSALPAAGGAMYSPEIRTNSDEAKLRVIEAK
jgi:alpha-2-macroglobulin